MCRVFKKNKNLRTKLQERAVSYEEHLEHLPDPLGSPEILSGNGYHRFAFPEYQPSLQSGYGGAIKREIINLDDDYQQPLRDHPTYSHPGGHLGMSVKAANSNPGSTHSMLSSDTAAAARNYLVRAFSFRRFPEEYLDIPESPSFQQGDFNDATTTSGSDGGDGDESILGLENLDWNALLQEPPSSTTTPIATTKEFSRCPSGKMIGSTDPSSVLVQIKRQNSDLFSSLELWNYSQVAQQM